MSELSIHNGEWVLVCDGGKALVLENAGDSKFPNLKTIEHLQHDHAATRDLGSDAPGRAPSSGELARSSVDQTDWHDQAEQTFLASVVKYLEAMLAAGRFKALIVVAPPRALGMLRPAYSPGLKAAIRAEVDKDYVKLPVYEIEKHLTAV